MKVSERKKETGREEGERDKEEKQLRDELLSKNTHRWQPMSSAQVEFNVRKVLRWEGKIDWKQEGVLGGRGNKNETYV